MLFCSMWFRERMYKNLIEYVFFFYLQAEAFEAFIGAPTKVVYLSIEQVSLLKLSTYP